MTLHLAPTMRGTARVTLLAIVAAVLASCAGSQPTGFGAPGESAVVQPRGEVLHASRAPVGFSYRTLTRADFRAKLAPKSVRSDVHRLAAASCILIVPIVDGRIVPSDPPVRFHIREIAFEARFAPTCSWWASDVDDAQREYVLEHEQIHFALDEIAARQLNARAPEIAREMESTGDDAHQVTQRVVAKIKRLLQDTLKRQLVLHTAFDEETSGQRNQPAQQRWLARVQGQLDTLSVTTATGSYPATLQLVFDCRTGKRSERALERCSRFVQDMHAELESSDRALSCDARAQGTAPRTGRRESPLDAHEIEDALLESARADASWRRLSPKEFARRAIAQRVCATASSLIGATQPGTRPTL